ncbi:tRNA epoxyqueuosine(34) reductase QueG [Acetobacterium fimetarium]|uniref:tRNA epoxyqueuosine(34) reductase QueG n=1 Tax=Acetobacterium fimetarium TaxID=52691 RepID=A0ABR6WVR5_9FIRM|nr:tRNA epoxyqueuosine(34) reductase QueG [Acetobacterium fimetarium]MBC3804707.1 tRNA epoxyqueuosine(34) reductase QueG [Acetobacterium fimetarium]
MKDIEIRKFASEIGIDLIGFFSVEPLEECLPHLIERYQAGLITGFEGGHPNERIDYHRSFPDAKSGIAIGIGYYQEIKTSNDQKERGALASVAWGEDYHAVLKSLMDELMAKINDDLMQRGMKPISYKAFVDNSPLVDRGSAYRAGLGFFGKNNLLINRDLGSYFFIGQILLADEIEFSPAEKIPERCGACRRCLDACPNGALGDGYTLDPSKCVSFLTQKKDLSNEEEKRVEKYLYGCDLCQKVCPYNKNLKKTSQTRFLTSGDLVYPEIAALFAMTNREFKEKYGKTAAGWRGKKTLLRNALLIEKNDKKK